MIYEIYSEHLKEYVGFFRKQDDKIFNFFGGWNYFKPSEHHIIYEVDDYYELPLQERLKYILKETSLYGWLSPDGEFYGCQTLQHSKVISELFAEEKDEYDVEEDGWIKIYPDPISLLGEPQFYLKHYTMLTRKQFDFLVEKYSFEKIHYSFKYVAEQRHWI